MVSKPRRLEYSTISIRCDGIKSQIHHRFWANFNFCNGSGPSCRGNVRQCRFSPKTLKIVISHKICFLVNFHKQEECRKQNLHFNPLLDEAHLKSIHWLPTRNTSPRSYCEFFYFYYLLLCSTPVPSDISQTPRSVSRQRKVSNGNDDQYVIL